MAAKKSKKPGDIAFANLSSGIPEGHTTIAYAALEKLLKDTKRIEILNLDTAFDAMLAKMLKMHFSQRDKVVEKLFEPSIEN